MTSTLERKRAHPHPEAPPPGRSTALLRAPRSSRAGALRRDRRLTAALAAGAVLLVAAPCALLMPRGAATTAQALVLIAAGLFAGGAAGYLMGSRGAMLVAAVPFAAAYEVRWAFVDGPTVDAPRFDTAYGILAILLGRGFLALVALVPLLLGVTLGAALARRLAGTAARPATRRGRVGLWTRRTVTVLVAFGVAALALLIARPASTPPILGPDGEALPGSIASLEQVEIGGVEQWLLIRGHSVDRPVILYLSGGPGQTDMPQVRSWWRDLERDFVIVNWDERGVGKSYAQLDPTSEITIERAVADTIELTNYLRDRFDEEKVYLVGESWGTLLGALAVEQHPELFHAYVGSGQMVSIRETDRLLYRDVIAYAERTGDEGLATTMRGFGEPPYDDVFANAFVMGYYDRLAGPYELLPYLEERADEVRIGPWGVLGSEYTLVDRVNVLRGLIDYAATMYPRAQEVDLRRDAARLEVPVYLVQGRHELAARTALVPEWLEQLDAPAKRMWWFEHAGHSTAFEEFRLFHSLMTGTVVPETYPFANR